MPSYSICTELVHDLHQIALLRHINIYVTLVHKSFSSCCFLQLHAKIPKTLLPQYKSPCWHYNGKLTCLPYFYLIGMPKCGTTDLWDKLVQHPQVAKVPKEPHWWAKRRNGWTKTPIHAEQGEKPVWLTH